jgi:catechol 2,3-dioxygenase-like lactoylglutathione lyase family enzyme
MESSLGHIQFGVRPENAQFYKEFLSFLGWQTIFDSPEMVGLSGKGEASLWFGTGVNASKNDYDGPGINHLGLHVGSVADVDATVRYLQDRGVPALFETPRHRPDFASSENDTYYQVMFETPDRILLEVVYVGPK